MSDPMPDPPADDGQRLTVLLVDDQQLVRSGFALILSVEDDIEVVGQAADGAQAIDLARRLRPDVILMDVEMPVLDGIAATAHIVAEGLGRVIILTTFDRDDYLFAALSAGASGFLLKNADPDHLVEGVRSVGHGYALLAPEVTRRVIQQMVGHAPVPARAGTGNRTETRGPVTRPRGTRIRGLGTRVTRTPRTRIRRRTRTRPRRPPATLDPRTRMRPTWPGSPTGSGRFCCWWRPG